MKEKPGRRVQLHRALSKLGWGLRGQAWAWIRAGEVRVDGRVVTDPLTWVDLDRQHITRGGEGPPPAARVTLALHKPAGVVTTRSDERGRRTVYDLLPPGLPWVFPAGRLDADSEGLLILTSDAQLAVRSDRPGASPPQDLSRDDQRRPGRGGAAPAPRGHRPGRRADAPGRRARAGARRPALGGRDGADRGPQPADSADVGGAGPARDNGWCGVAIGGLELGDLPPGACRELGEAEVGRLVVVEWWWSGHHSPLSITAWFRTGPIQVTRLWRHVSNVPKTPGTLETCRHSRVTPA